MPILPGRLGIGEMSFHRIQAFESEYCVIAPTYPFATTTADQLVEGITGILDAENIERAHMLGGSYGRMLAHQSLICFFWCSGREPFQGIHRPIHTTG